MKLEIGDTVRSLRLMPGEIGVIEEMKPADWYWKRLNLQTHIGINLSKTFYPNTYDTGMVCYVRFPERIAAIHPFHQQGLSVAIIAQGIKFIPKYDYYAITEHDLEKVE